MTKSHTVNKETNPFFSKTGTRSIVHLRKSWNFTRASNEEMRKDYEHYRQHFLPFGKSFREVFLIMQINYFFR